MELVRPGEFERALGTLDRDALAAFVADLWAAGGWETSLADGAVVAERAGRRRHVRVVAAGRRRDRIRRLVRIPGHRGPGTSGLGDADVVVDASGAGRVAAAARAAGAEYVPPAALRNRLLYGVPRDVGEALAERHLGRSLQAVRGSDGAPPLADSGRLLLGAVVAVLLVGAFAVAAGPLGVPFGGAGPPTAAPAAGQATAEGPTPSATASAWAAELPERTRAGAPAAPPFPPGLSPGGVENLSALVDAHVETTEGHRYALSVSFDGPPAAAGFGNYSTVRWSVRVESRYRYLVDATYRRPDRRSNGGKPPWRSSAVYADGVTTFRRTATPNRTRYAARPDGAGDSRVYLSFAAAVIERYLDTGAAVVRRAEAPEGPRFHVVAAGTPERLDGAVVDYRAEALVTPGGRVTTLSVRYTLPVDGRERSVRVLLDYGGFGTTRVERPNWYDEARNETAG